MEDIVTPPAPEAAPSATPADDGPGDMSAGDLAALNSALGIATEAKAEPAPLESAVASAPATQSTQTTAPAVTAESPATSPAAQTKFPELPGDKLRALLEAKKRATAPAAEQAALAAQERAEAARLRAEAEGLKQGAEQRAAAILEMAKRDPGRFLREHLGLTTAEQMEKYARDAYFASKGEKAPEAYQAVQRQREVETETQRLQKRIDELEGRVVARDQEQETQRYVQEYASKTKEAAAKTDQKAAPWVARAYAKNPERVTQHLVGMAAQISREHGQVLMPEELIPILESEMEEQFGKYEFGEAKPAASPTLDNKLASPPKRLPVTADTDDRDASLARTIAGLQAGEHLRE